MSEITLLDLHKTTPGGGAWMGKALDRLTATCAADPHSETDGREIGEHLLESFCAEPEKSRYKFLIAVNATEIRGHVIARIDTGYENRRECWVGFFALDRGFNWEELVNEGFPAIEDWAKGHGCAELLVSCYSQSHARLYRLPRYGGFETRNLVLSRRID